MIEDINTKMLHMTVDTSADLPVRIQDTKLNKSYTISPALERLAMPKKVAGKVASRDALVSPPAKRKSKPKPQKVGRL